MRTFIRFAFECVWCMHDDNDTCVIICAWFKACTPAVPIPTIVNWRWRFVMLNVKQMTTPFQNHLLFNYFFVFFLGYCYCWFPSFFHVWYLVIYIIEWHFDTSFEWFAGDCRQIGYGQLSSSLLLRVRLITGFCSRKFCWTPRHCFLVPTNQPNRLIVQ